MGTLGCGKKPEAQGALFLGTTVAYGNGVIWVQAENGTEFQCFGDGPAHFQDYVTASILVAGDCHDTGIVNPNFHGGPQ